MKLQLQSKGGHKVVASQLVLMSASERPTALAALLDSTSSRSARRVDEVLQELPQPMAEETLEDMDDFSLGMLIGDQGDLTSVAQALVSKERLVKIVAADAKMRPSDGTSVQLDVERLFSVIWSFCQSDEFSINTVAEGFGPELFALIMSHGGWDAELEHEDEGEDGDLSNEEKSLLSPSELENVTDEGRNLLEQLCEIDAQMYRESMKLARKRTLTELTDDVTHILQRAHQEDVQHKQTEQGVVAAAMDALLSNL